MASLPFIAALVGVLISATVSDLMVKSGLSLGMARKLPIIIGLAMTVFMLGANYTDSTALVIVFMTIAFFGNGFALITWSLVSALAPERLLGLTGGLFNFIGNLSSTATTIVIGFLVTDIDLAPGIRLHGGEYHRRCAVVCQAPGFVEAPFLGFLSSRGFSRGLVGPFRMDLDGRAVVNC